MTFFPFPLLLLPLYETFFGLLGDGYKVQFLSKPVVYPKELDKLVSTIKYRLGR